MILCWAKCTDTCFVSSGSRIRYTTGNNLAYIMYDPWFIGAGLYTGIEGNLELAAFCLSFRSERFLRANSNAICRFSRLELADSYVEVHLPTWRMVITYSRVWINRVRLPILHVVS